MRRIYTSGVDSKVGPDPMPAKPPEQWRGRRRRKAAPALVQAERRLTPEEFMMKAALRDRAMSREVRALRRLIDDGT